MHECTRRYCVGKVDEVDTDLTTPFLNPIHQSLTHSILLESFLYFEFLPTKTSSIVGVSCPILLKVSSIQISGN